MYSKRAVDIVLRIFNRLYIGQKDFKTTTEVKSLKLKNKLESIK
jgi:hypothetical protein